MKQQLVNLLLQSPIISRLLRHQKNSALFMPHIAIVWDFDGTLTPDDSTTKVVEVLQGEEKGGDFWAYIKSLRGDKKAPKWEHVLASDAPIWMYSLSRLASERKVPLNSEFFREFVISSVKTYKNVENFLRTIKALEERPEFIRVDLKIHHFIISAGLKELVEQVLPEGLITWAFGCRYEVIISPGYEDEPESIPVFCMDETMKTRSLFEISKGSFYDEGKSVNTRVEKQKLWAPFENIIYIGDGDTDIPALSLVRSKGGLGIAVYDPSKDTEQVHKKLKTMRINKRADLITAADFSKDSELFDYLSLRCNQIRQRYEAEQVF